MRSNTFGLGRNQLCDRTSFISILVYVACTLLAQVTLTMRIYAITRKNHIITTCFGVIMASQLALGIYFIVLTATKQTQYIQTTLLDSRGLCFFEAPRAVEVGFPAISLLYDLLAFLLIIHVALRSTMYQFRMPTLFRIIAQDATRYFLVIFSSHLVLELMLAFGRPTIKRTPSIGNIVFLPVMVTRLILSLKKAAASQESGWSLGELTTTSSVRFAGVQGFGTTRDDIRLDNFEGARNRA